MNVVPPRRFRFFKKPPTLPGFALSFGFVVTYLTLLVLIPICAVLLTTAQMGWSAFWDAVTDERALAAYGLTFGASLCAAAVNVVLGFATAWALVRYRFPGRRILDALIDLPFAIPTAVSGIALTAVFAPNGWVGAVFARYDVPIAFTRGGVVLALIFIGIPFVVRTVESALLDLDEAPIEAARSLGASRAVIFWRIILPECRAALFVGFALSFARAVGEYGSVIFIAGNMPYRTEIAPLLIMTKLEQYDYAGATAIASTLLVISFVMLFALNQARTRIGRAVSS